MSERSLSVGPVVEPCAGGVIGLGIGYSLAPRKYALKNLLTLSEDKFEKIYSQDLANNMTLSEQHALQNLRQARYDYHTSGNPYMAELNAAARNWMNKFKAIEISQTTKDAYAINKSNLQKSISELDYVKLHQDYRAAKAALKASPDNEALKSALTEANSNLAKAKAVISSKIDLYKESVKNVSAERLAKIENEPIKYSAVKESYKDFISVLEKRRTAISNKLFELSNKKELLRSYETLKDFLPRARTKSALVGATIVGAMISILVLSLNNAARRSA